MARRLPDAETLRDEADIESAIRAEELAEAGDEAGVAVWRRVTGAVRQLVNITPPGPVH